MDLPANFFDEYIDPTIKATDKMLRDVEPVLRISPDMSNGRPNPGAVEKLKTAEDSFKSFRENWKSANDSLADFRDTKNAFHLKSAGEPLSSVAQSLESMRAAFNGVTNPSQRAVLLEASEGIEKQLGMLNKTLAAAQQISNQRQPQQRSRSADEPRRDVTPAPAREKTMHKGLK